MCVSTHAHTHTLTHCHKLITTTMKMDLCLVIVLWMMLASVIHRALAVECAANAKCQCLPEYVSCRGVIHLPDVLDSRLLPLRESPPLTADLRRNALTEGTVRRFLIIFSTILRVMLTEQLETRCEDVQRLIKTFPHVTFESECVVSLIFLWQCHC